MALRSRFYLDKRNAKFMGVCSGIADYFGVNALWVRLAAVFMVLFGMPLLIVAYIVVGFIASPKPAELYDDPQDEREFWRDVRTKPQATLQNVRARIRSLERRLRNLEARATSSAHRLNREIDSLRDA